MGLIRTGKMLDADTAKRLHEMANAAATTPAIVFSQCRLGPYAKTEAQIMWEHFYRAANEACVAAGFPEPEKDADGDVINYGIDFGTGEVLLWDGKL